MMLLWGVGYLPIHQLRERRERRGLHFALSDVVRDLELRGLLRRYVLDLVWLPEQVGTGC
jgi:hypothetical protein